MITSTHFNYQLIIIRMDQSTKLEYSAFLQNSSGIFNAQRLTLNKVYQMQQLQKMNKLLGVVASVTSENIRSANMSEVQTFLKGQQQAISSLMQKLQNVKNGLQTCQAAYNRAKTTDISEDDERFLLHILYQHGYISDKFEKGSLIQMIRQIRQNMQKQQRQLNNSSECQSENIQLEQNNNNNNINNNNNNNNNDNNNSNNYNANHTNININNKSNEQNISLQNYRASRMHGPNNLCSIACQLSKYVKEQEGQCSLQFDLMNPQKIQHMISKRYLDAQDSLKFDGTACKTYEQKQLKIPCISKNASKNNTQNERTKLMIKNQRLHTKQQQLLGLKEQKYKKGLSNGVSLKNRKQQQQLHPSNLIQVPLPEHQCNNPLKLNSNTLSSNQTVQIGYPANQKQPSKHSHQDNQTIYINQIGKETFSGKFGVIDYEIHFSCVRKISLQNGQVFLWVSPFGVLHIKFKDNNQSKLFFQSINGYSLTHQQDYKQ